MNSATVVLSSMTLDKSRSQGDLKNYRLVQLTSGLEALLVSTKVKGELRGESNTKSSAAMSVQVGSFADPAVAGDDVHLYFIFASC